MSCFSNQIFYDFMSFKTRKNTIPSTAKQIFHNTDLQWWGIILSSGFCFVYVKCWLKYKIGICINVIVQRAAQRGNENFYWLFYTNPLISSHISISGALLLSSPTFFAVMLSLQSFIYQLLLPEDCRCSSYSDQISLTQQPTYILKRYIDHKYYQLLLQKSRMPIKRWRTPGASKLLRQN